MVTHPRADTSPNAWIVEPDPRFDVRGGWWTAVALHLAINAVTSRDGTA